jgi:hypothetical protein
MAPLAHRLDVFRVRAARLTPADSFVVIQVRDGEHDLAARPPCRLTVDFGTAARTWRRSVQSTLSLTLTAPTGTNVANLA